MFYKRKELRMKYYNYSDNGYYFITICTENRKKLLCTIDGELGSSGRPTPTDINEDTFESWCGREVILTRYGLIVREALEFLNHRNGIEIHKYVIMPNHIHLIVIISRENNQSSEKQCNELIPKTISSLKRYTNKQSGQPIWQRGYYEHVIRNEEDYKNIYEYIESNVEKWKYDKYYID